VKSLGVSLTSFYRWRTEYGSTDRDAVKRIKELERENVRLKRLVEKPGPRYPDPEGGGQGGILSSALARRAIQHVNGIFDISQRRACRLLGQHRSVQRRALRENPYRTRLAARLRALSRKHPRRGWRHMQDLLSREGWRVNHKPLRHVWREEGLNGPQIRRKRSRIGSSSGGIMRKRATMKNEVWA